jgi:hypothetical protein
VISADLDELELHRAARPAACTNCLEYALLWRIRVLATVPPWQLLGSRGRPEALHCEPHRREELGLEVPPVEELHSSSNRVGSLDRSQVSDTPPPRNVTVAIVSGLGVAVCTES